MGVLSAPIRVAHAYRPIEDYGAIGEGRSAALVSQDGSVDWWCPGRFDAPSVFGALLDGARGGRFRIAPSDAARSSSRYVVGSNVLETTHEISGGARLRTVDALIAPRESGVRDAVLVRRAIAEGGAVSVDVEFAPRFQYGRIAPRYRNHADGLLARGAGESLLLEGQAPGRFLLAEGDQLEYALRHTPYDASDPFPEALAATPSLMQARALARWQAWDAQTIASGPYAAEIRRAALALKLLQHDETGAIVAAASTSLPEDVGGVRNWDYRFAWIRDGALCADALAMTGHAEDARDFARWVHRAVGPEGEKTGILYTVSGEPGPEERVLSDLEGWRSSKPVRVGNGAVHQRQLDVSGELLDFLARAGVSHESPAAWETCRRLADWVAGTWREPDSGIWEMRCPPRHFLLSKAMAWAALDRATGMALAHGMPGDVQRWREEAAIIRRESLRDGWDDELGSFVQAFGFKALDASNLLLPLIGFVDARDPRMVATVDKTLQQLTVDGLVYRYLDADGIEGGEATFAYCTFWLAEALAMQGRVAEARGIFEGMLRRASHLGLYAEEIDAASGAHLGNFPQGFPHAGLIRAALALGG